MKKIVSFLLLFSLAAAATAESSNLQDLARCSSGSIQTVLYEPNDQDHTIEKMTIVMDNKLDYYTINATLQRLLYAAFINHQDLEIYSYSCVSDPQIVVAKFFK